MSRGVSSLTPASRASALWTLPNAVSMSRVGLAAVFLATTETNARVALLAAASLSDFLDGWLARRRNAVSRWGALLDPIGDRAFVFAATATLVAGGRIGPIECVVLLFRDIMTAIGFIVARIVKWLRPITFRARPLGKGVTALQLGTLLAAILRPAAVTPLVAAVGVTSVAATVDYTMALWRERDRTLKP
ncbi:CDP-alcohol phosphatidyltransferase [Gemmatirosa kalamazoonensis]|uniref:CDP-diacylglycerol--glycerol-3-phosphate 3-phosphatidyltransferase n=1 Tax=Gemmatirosa kalamazoonensis TaxID=861299 RepID=W0RN55_9BACT|nr:CDP-alcohol phosphatidyltransferase family protein [Gemmatirosa kalamazoonensis]AHG91740.1 CDP-alcohol phosphatidyltransferase [Gemmatirosa kalamazoonensis]